MGWSRTLRGRRGWRSLRSEERCVGKECRSWRDWSSDVCSSDLEEQAAAEHVGAAAEELRRGGGADGVAADIDARPVEGVLLFHVVDDVEGEAEAAWGGAGLSAVDGAGAD